MAADYPKNLKIFLCFLASGKSFEKSVRKSKNSFLYWGLMGLRITAEDSRPRGQVFDYFPLHMLEVEECTRLTTSTLVINLLDVISYTLTGISISEFE